MLKTYLKESAWLASGQYTYIKTRLLSVDEVVFGFSIMILDQLENDSSDEVGEGIDTYLRQGRVDGGAKARK